MKQRVIKFINCRL